MSAGRGKIGANTVADINAQFIANDIPITATNANQRITFLNDVVSFPKNTVNYPFVFVKAEIMH